MPGKWSGLRGVAPPAPVDTDWQGKVNATKSQYENLPKGLKGIEFCQLRDLKDELEEQISQINLKLEALSQLMIPEMEREGTDLFRLSSGDTLSIKDEPYTSVEDKQQFLAWVKQSGLEDLLSVHYQTMNSMTKDRLLQGLEPPPGLKVFIKQSITRRRARA